MTDTKIRGPWRVGIGYDTTHYTAIGSISEISAALRTKDGVLLDPLDSVVDIQPTAVGHKTRWYESEVVLNSDNVEAFTTQDVVPGVGTGYALRDSAYNDEIGYLCYQFKKKDNTNLSFTWGTTKLIYAHGKVSNLKGTRSNPCTYRFMHIPPVTKGTNDLTTPVSTDRFISGINKVTINASDLLQILDLEWEFLTTIEPQIIPNVSVPIGLHEWPGKMWRYLIRVDGTTDVFDPYVDDDGENAVIPSMSVLFNGRVNSTKTAMTELHTLEANHCYVRKLDPVLKADEPIDGEKVSTYEILNTGTRVVTHP